MQEIFNRPLNIGDLVFDMDLKYPSIDSFGIVLSDNRIFIGRGREVNCDSCYLIENPGEVEMLLKQTLAYKYNKRVTTASQRKIEKAARAKEIAKEQNATTKKILSDSRFKIGAILETTSYCYYTQDARYIYLGKVMVYIKEDEIPKDYISMVHRYTKGPIKFNCSIEGNCYVRVGKEDFLDNLSLVDFCEQAFERYLNSSITYYGKLNLSSSESGNTGAIFVKNVSKRFKNICGNISWKDIDLNAEDLSSNPKEIRIEHFVRDVRSQAKFCVPVYIKFFGI